MTRIAILGGGISGLTAAYELELARRRGVPIDWHLYEAADRLGGILQTTRHTTPEGDFILEGGPDAWVSEKPWARDIALELGLEDQLIYSNDATRKTYILRNGELLPTPDRMRLMVPEDLSVLDNSPLFSDSAKTVYAAELNRAEQLRAAAPTDDESVASFVHRHFGEEVLITLAAPLLSGVFGGDVHKLSVRAVMPQFVAMEREHGSLIAALQAKSQQRIHESQPIFTTLRNGMASLTEALVTQLPPERVNLNASASSLRQEIAGWHVLFKSRHPERSAQRAVEGPPHLASAADPSCFDHIFLSTPADATRNLLAPLDPTASSLLPSDASSATLIHLVWPAALARTVILPPGFGFLVPPPDQRPPTTLSSRPERSEVERPAVQDARTGKEPPLLTESEPRLLACTFVDQKFPHRAPAGARILRAFFGGPSAETLTTQSDATIGEAALTQLRSILGRIPDPSFTTVRRLPRSLPQYEIGHLDRIAQLEALVAQPPGLHLLGNAYHGVGLPDLIHAARTAARALAARATL
jgi:oxygen-dependent protoporphyrinogen oxidase